MRTLVIICFQDVVKFMTVFFATLVILSGAFYLSLRYDDTLITHPGSNTTLPGGGVNSDVRNLHGVGQLLYDVYFLGLRALIEAGSVLNYGGLRCMHSKNTHSLLDDLYLASSTVQ